MKIVKEKEKLTENYFKKMFVLLEREKLPLAKWNLIQKKLWQQLVDDNYVNKNDSEAFYVVAKFFDDYYQKHGKIAGHHNIVNYIGGY